MCPQRVKLLRCTRRQRSGRPDRAAAYTLIRPGGMEATGGFETIVAAGLAGAQLPLVVINPAHIRHFAQGRRQACQERSDGRAVIARFAEAVKPEPRPLPDRRRVFSPSWSPGAGRSWRPWWRNVSAGNGPTNTRAQEHRARSARAREGATRDRPRHRRAGARLARLAREGGTAGHLPGHQEYLARTFLAEMPELGRLTRREIASLAGVAPFTRQSGQWKGKSKVAGGRAPVRAGLYMAALSAVRFNRPIKAFYQRLSPPVSPRWSLSSRSLAKSSPSSTP